MEFAFRRRYGLPPTDPRFLDAGLDEMLVDWWAHRFTDDPKLRDEVVNADFEADVEAMERAMMDAGPDGWEEVAADSYA